MTKKICRKCSVISETDGNKCPNCGTPYKKGIGCLGWIVVAILIVLIISVWGNLADEGKKESNKYTQSNTQTDNETTSDNSTEKEEAPVISDIKWHELNKIYNISSKYSDLQKDKLWEQYKGKYVKWSGVVSAVSSKSIDKGIDLQVKMNPETFTSDLLIDISEDQEDMALKYKEGDRITFTGKLDSWGTLLPISLSDGKIIENNSK